MIVRKKMGMDMDLLELHVIGAVFLLFVALLALINRWSSRYSKGKRSDTKKKIYACGEDIRPTHMNVPQESFYYILIRSLKLDKFKQWHSGDLTRYLVWVFTGMVLIMIYLLFLWGM